MVELTICPYSESKRRLHCGATIALPRSRSFNLWQIRRPNFLKAFENERASSEISLAQTFGLIVSLRWRARRDLLALFIRQGSVKLLVNTSLRMSAILKEPVERFAVAPARISRERPAFIRRQIAVRAACRFQRFEQLDRGYVVIET